MNLVISYKRVKFSPKCFRLNMLDSFSSKLLPHRVLGLTITGVKFEEAHDLGAIFLVIFKLDDRVFIDQIMKRKLKLRLS